MAEIVLKHVQKVYPNNESKKKGFFGKKKKTEEKKHNLKVTEDGVLAVEDFNLTVHDQEFIVLVGPSGCGKSTTMRMIAGLEDITSGDVLIDGKRVNDVAPKDRDIAMVFQSYALYPNMTVYENMAFTLELKKVPKDEIDRKVRSAAEILGITQYLDRKPKALSGGQRQRVAIGRAIVRDPKVFLMDEPLSNLDAKLRSHMRVELATLHHKLGVTTIYVTHDQTEAMTLADRIVVMKAGYIQQVATPIDLYNHPTNMFVAGFIGSPSMNFLRGKVKRAGKGAAFLTEGGQVFPLTKDQADVLWPQHDNRALVLGIRPEDIYASAAHAGPVCGEMQGMVTACEALGNEAILHLENEDGEIAARVAPDHGATAGEAATLYVNMANAHFFDGETEQNLFYQWRNDA